MWRLLLVGRPWHMEHTGAAHCNDGAESQSNLARRTRGPDAEMLSVKIATKRYLQNSCRALSGCSPGSQENSSTGDEILSNCTDTSMQRLLHQSQMKKTLGLVASEECSDLCM
ncbi:Ankyrin Repeat And Sam Domain-Containing Protein 1A [Manis pentadactyla]|nr:Ankyrin Repeat And Sam Domain-Containing Protein 1A [Manis pentadactyla]